MKFQILKCAAVLGVLGGCAPLLTPQVQEALSHVHVERIPERIGQKLRKSLFVQFQSEGQPPLYTLSVTLKEKTSDFDVGPDGRARVAQVSICATYRLCRLADQKIIASGVCTAPNYKALHGAYYSQTTADHFIQDNSLRFLVQRLTLEVARALSNEKIKTEWQ